MGGCVAVVRQISFDNIMMRNGGASSGPSPDHSTSQKLTQNIVKINHRHNVNEIYTVHEHNVLGSGMNGEVVTCVHKITNRKYALKWLNKSEVSATELNRIRDELRCLAHLDHPNILRVYEVFESEEDVCLILELCTGGTLLDRLRSKYRGYFCEFDACRYIYSILGAVAYCHAHNIVHRDLKLENIVFEDESTESELKIIDFGLSKIITARSRNMHEICGTSDYVAPEVLKGKYDARCDVWSIGVIAFMLLSGKCPFGGETASGILDAVLQGDFDFTAHMINNVSCEARHFIKQCLTTWPASRPTARMALRHQWFKTMKVSTRPMPSPLLMRRFAKYIMRSWLAKIFIDAVAHTLSPESVAELRDQFNRFDLSGTGEISIEDLRGVMRHFQGYNEDHIEPLLSNVDIDQTGQISYHEFLAATIDRTHFTEENLQLAFERVSGHRAYITSAGIKHLLGACNYDVDEIMLEVGLPKNARIDFEMFKNILDGDDDVGISLSNRTPETQLDISAPTDAP